MCLMTAIGMAANLIGSAMEAKQKNKIARQQQQLDFDRAQREKEIGVLNARRQRRETSDLLALQTALTAGTGGAPSQGSRLLISENTAREGEFAARLEESNAATKAKAIRDQANIDYAAAMAESSAGLTSGIFKAGTTLLKSDFGKKTFGIG